jgi:single-stranded-DNA-specific exonuclease
MKTFELRTPVSEEVKTALSSYHPVLQQLLYNRGITTTLEAQNFIFPSYERDLHDPFLLPDMEKAVLRIQSAILNNEKVVVFSDYDCDGIPGAVILNDFFSAIGFTNFSTVIPHRHYDGFGLRVKTIETIHKEYRPSLIITVDCGTTDLEAIARAGSYGIDVVVTDHHQPKAELPNAVAVVNPSIGSTYPFSGLCGAGVVFKLVQALILRGGYEVPAGAEKWWLDMVGIATIADMVPLTGENRALAHFGLKVLRKSRRPGIQQLLRAQKVNQSYLTEDDIGFTIGPRINAASRMDTPEDAFQLLATRDEGEAGARVAHLEKLNGERKTAIALITKDIHKRLAASADMPDILVMGNPDWRPSLVGLAANKLAEEHKRPVFLWGRDGNGEYKGSCRSDGTASVVRIMEAVPDVFAEFGGHHFSGGFSVLAEHIHTFSEQLQNAFRTLGDAVAIQEVSLVDAALTLDEINASFLEAQALCAPFGMDNPKPLYIFHNVTPNAVTQFGKTKEHTKLTFSTTGKAREAIAFFRLPEQFLVEPKVGYTVSLLAHVEQSFFMGRLDTRLRIVDIID